MQAYTFRAENQYLTRDLRSSADPIAPGDLQRELRAYLEAGLGDREAAVCRELTKLHEEVRRGSLAELAGAYRDLPEPRGEIVIVTAPPPEQQPTGADEVDALLRDALERLSVKDAVDEVAGVSGQSRRDVYRRALALKADHDGPQD